MIVLAVYALILYSIAVVLLLSLLIELIAATMEGLLPGSIVKRSDASFVNDLAILGRRFIVLLSYLFIVLSVVILLSVIGRYVAGV